MSAINIVQKQYAWGDFTIIFEIIFISFLAKTTVFVHMQKISSDFVLQSNYARASVNKI